jgi:hypothetical protein
MTPLNTFDERARTLTKSLLTDAGRVPSRLRRERANSAPWKAVAVFAGTVVVIGAAVVGASIALRSTPVVKPAPAAPGGHWRSFQLPPVGSSAVAVSCPTVKFCVAVDYGGDWFVSTDPGGGAHAWKIATGVPPTPVPSSGDMTTGVSCVGRSLCVAVDQRDQRGYVFVGTNLNGSPSMWDVALVDSHVAFTGISCPAPSLCVAVGGNSPSLNQVGVVLTSTSPASRPDTWARTEIDSATGLTAISCPTVTFCVATDGVGDIVTSRDPSGSTGAWRVSKVIDTNSFTAISCPTVHFCAAVDTNGQVVTSTDPTGGPDAWTTTTLDGSLRFDSVSCPSAGFCVAGGLSDSVFVSNDPTGGSGAWTKTRVIPRGVAAMFGLSCPTSGFCVGVDGSDGAHIYTNPAP